MTIKLTATLGLVAVALSASACSTKPRQFSAQVRPVAGTPLAATSGPREGVAYTSCDAMVRKGRKSGFASAAAMSGAGAVGAVGGMGVAFTGLGGGTLASAGATAAAAIPVLGIVAAFGMNRAIRGGRERGYRKHMTACMDEMGYQVVDWSRAPKKEHGTASLSPETSAPNPGAADTVATARELSVEPVSSADDAQPSLVKVEPGV